jgi:phosphatidylserine decarboxylase
LKSYTLPLKMLHANKWEDKHNPQLFIKAKYVPYPALRQQFWRCLLNQYEADDGGRLTRLELVTMLESIGSTLSEQTINTFFQRFKQPSTQTEPVKENEELTIGQIVICLEDQLLKQSQTAAQRHLTPPDSASELTGNLTEKNPATNLSEPTSSPVESGYTAELEDKLEEHVIAISECPLCHHRRMNKRSEVDIVTHIATCASQDWRQVDRFVMGGFLTSDQAHRKWYTNVQLSPSCLS